MVKHKSNSFLCRVTMISAYGRPWSHLVVPGNTDWIVSVQERVLLHDSSLTRMSSPPQIQQPCIVSGDPKRTERLCRPARAHRRKHDDQHLCRTHQIPPGPETGAQDGERGREGGVEFVTLRNDVVHCHLRSLPSSAPV